MAIDFVKFIRGNEESYQRLLDNNATDKNTLYFIYDKNSSAANPTGKLYLDKFLISNANTNTESLSLKDLTDTNIQSPNAGDILTYNGSKWQPVLGSDFFTNTNFATKVKTNIVPETDESQEDAIKRIFENSSNPGDIGILEDGTVFLSEKNNNWLKLIDGTVRNANISDITSNISNLQLLLNNIYTKNETEFKINELIANKNHLSYEIKPNIEDINVNDSANQNKVFLIAKSTSDTNNNYDEFMIINGSLEKVGDWGADLSNYVQNNDNRLLTDGQKNKLDNLIVDETGHIIIDANNVQNLSESINQHQFVKSVDNTVFNVTADGKLELKNSYITTTMFNSVVGDLNDLGQNRVSPNSTFVDEILSIKESITWEEII